MAAGTAIADLVLRFTGDIAGIKTAVDGISSTLNSLERNVEKTASSIKDKFGDIAGAIAAGFSIEAFRGLIDGAISAQATLKGLAEQNGTTVEVLSGLQEQAKIAGAPFEVVGAALTKLNKSLVESTDSSSKQAAAMKALGLSATDANGQLKNSGDFFVELATKLDEYADGSTKTAAAQVLMGKAAAAQLPLLRDIAEAGKLNIKTTADQAAAAEAYEKNSRRLSVALGDLSQSVANSLLPVMSDVVKALLDAEKQSDSLGGAIRDLSADGTFTEWARDLAIAGARVVDTFGFMGHAIAAFGASVDVVVADSKLVSTALSVVSGNLLGAGQLPDLLKDRNAKLAAANDTWKSLWNDNVRVAEDALKARFKESDLMKKLLADDASLAAERGTSGSSGKPQVPNFTLDTGAVNAMKDYQNAIDAAHKALVDAQIAQAEFLNPNQVTAAAKAFAQLQNTDGWKKLTAAQKEEVASLFNVADAIEKGTQASKDSEAAAKAAADAQLKQQEALKTATDGATQSYDALIAKLQLQTVTVGLTSAAAERYAAVQQLIDDKNKGLIVSTEEFDRRMKELNATFDNRDAAQANADAVKKSLEEQKNLWSGIENAAHDAFLHIGEQGESVFQRLADSLKHGLLELLYQLTIKKFIVNLQANLTGSGGGGGGVADLAAAAGGGGSGGLSGLFSGITGLGSSAAPAAGLYGAFATSSIGQGLGLSAALAGPPTAAGIGSVGLTTLGTSIGAAIPIVGWIAAAASIIYSLVQSSKQPAQVKGSFGIGSGPFEDAQSTPSPFGNLGFLDAGTQQFSGAVGQGFSKLVSGLLTLFDSKLTASQHDVLQQALNSSNFGTLEGTFTTEDFLNKYGPDVLKQVAKTALDVLNPALSKVVDAFEGDAQSTVTFIGSLISLNDTLTQIPDQADALTSALTGTADNLAQVQAIATGFLTLDLVSGTANLTTNFQAALATATNDAYDNFISAGAALTKLANECDGSTASVTALTAATSSYAQQQVQLLVYIEQLKGSLNDLFNNSIESIKLSTLNPQEQYDYYETKINGLLKELSTTTDPSKVNDLAAQINQAITAAYSVLTPDQQKVVGDQFITILDQVNKQVQGTLGNISTDVSGASKSPFDAVNTALTDATTKIGAAADKEVDAANTNAAAANTNLAAARQPITVIVQDARTPEVSGA